MGHKINIWALCRKEVFYLLVSFTFISSFLSVLLRRGSVHRPLVSMRELRPRLRQTTRQVINDVPRIFKSNYDLVIAVLVTSTQGEEVDRVQKIYSRYIDQPGISSHVHKDWSHRVLLVVADENAPDEGLLDLFATPDVGVFRVPARNGYRHIAEKMRALMKISEHIGFSFLVKADSDTFPCLNHVMNIIRNLPDSVDRRRLYAGKLNKCGKLFPKGHDLHDPQFMDATLGQLPCHPVYHQGAFYILGRTIVEYLSISHRNLRVFSNEDAMVGMWLLSINRELVDIGGKFYCNCHCKPKQLDPEPFYHFCKTNDKIDRCMEKYPYC